MLKIRPVRTMCPTTSEGEGVFFSCYKQPHSEGGVKTTPTHAMLNKLIVTVFAAGLMVLNETPQKKD